MATETGQESFTVLMCDCAKSQNSSNTGTGTMAPAGYSTTFLRERALAINALDCSARAEIIEFNAHCPVDSEDACALVIRGTDPGLSTNSLQHVANEIIYDKFAVLQGKVKNAHSRHLVFVAEESRQGNPSTGIHTVLAWKTLPFLEAARNDVLNKFLADPYHVNSACILHYSDINKCGIRWHGDGERRRTILYRLGTNSHMRPIHFQWYLNSAPVCDPISITLNHGDYFIPSTKAVGTDWKVRKVPTLRHSTGFLNDGPAPKVSTRAAKRKRSFVHTH